MARTALATAVLLLTIAVGASARSTRADSLQTFETRYYILKTDVPSDEAREASLRMTKMAEEYAARTRDFSGEIRQKFPFYLIHDADVYLKHGGVSGSAGLFNGSALVVHVPDHVDARVWHVLQHEGFHQFAAAVIGGDRPVWVNEGLAEYFGEAIFTGDEFVTGIIPQWRLERMRREMSAGQFRSIDQMMQMNLDEWNSKLSIVNYDQGWSMVHFLIHGDGGKYRQAFAAFMVDLSRNRPWPSAWQDNFGDASGFQQRWQDFWQKLPDNPTAELSTKANVATLTSFLARAISQKQAFASYEAFAKSARQGSLKMAADQWLPQSLLVNAIADADDFAHAGASYSILTGSAPPRLACRLKSGARFIGRFTLRNGAIVVDVDESR